LIRGRETVLFSFSPKAYTQFAGFGWGSVLPLSPPCEVNLIQNLGVFLLIFLLFSFLEHKEEDKRGSAEAEDENAADSKRPCAVFTGHRSLKATRIYNLQRSDCVLGTRIHLIVEHRDVVAVNRCRCSLIFVSQLLLRDVGELIIFIVREVVARVVLDNTECIFAVNVARAVCIIHGLDRYVDIILEQRVAVCSLELCPDVLVVLNAFKDDLALFAIPFDGVHCCCRGFFVRVSGNIPDALVLIKLCNYIVAIGRILRFKEDVIEHRLFFFTVAKGFRDVRRIRVNMRVVDKGVVVGVIGTLPCEDDFVFVSVVTVNQRLIRIEFCVVTDTKCVIAVTCIELAVIVIVSRIGCVDLGKAIIGHGDRHRMRTVVVFFARNFEFAVGLLPRGNFVGAICIGKEFECNAVRAAYIREAAGQNILERIRADIGGRRRDRRQCGDDLIFYGVACGCRCVVCKAVGDNIRCVIYAGVFCSFTFEEPLPDELVVMDATSVPELL